MTITLELPEALERQLRKEAERNGVSLDKLIVQSLSDSEVEPDDNASYEERLCSKIIQWIPPHQHNTYRSLVKKRTAGDITPSEYEELLLLTDVVETAHAVRMHHLIQLAELRHVPLEDLLKAFGIPGNRYA